MDNLDYNYFNELIEELNSELKVCVNEEKYYLMDLFEATNNIVYKLNYLSNKGKTKYANLDTKINNLEEINGIKYNDKHKTYTYNFHNRFEVNKIFKVTDGVVSIPDGAIERENVDFLKWDMED